MAEFSEVFTQMKRMCKANACLAVFGVKNGWPDVGEKSIQHHRCWAVYAAIRYAMAWHDHPEGGDTVDFGKPLGYGEPLPKCEVKE